MAMAVLEEWLTKLHAGASHFLRCQALPHSDKAEIGIEPALTRQPRRCFSREWRFTSPQRTPGLMSVQDAAVDVLLLAIVASFRDLRPLELVLGEV